MLLLLIKSFFPPNIIGYDNNPTKEVKQQIIKAPSEGNSSIIVNKDRDNLNIRIVNVYNPLVTTLPMSIPILLIFFLIRRSLFDTIHKIKYIATIYFNVGKYKDMITFY